MSAMARLLMAIHCGREGQVKDHVDLDPQAVR